MDRHPRPLRRLRACVVIPYDSPLALQLKSKIEDVSATLGKFGGSLLAARICGLPWRFSAAIGILMNTRGLMELIVLNLGLDLGIISPPLFAMLVVMALVTTFATTPVLAWLGEDKVGDRS